MSSGVFVVDVIVTLLLSGYLLYHYGDWMRHRVAVTLAVLIAWYFSFLIIFVLPLDVSSTCYRQCVDEEKNKTAEALAEWHKMNDLHMNNEETNNNNSTISANSSGSNNNSSSNANVTAPMAAPLSLAPMCHPPYSKLPDDVLPNLWKVVYWSSQLLTWLVLPLMQSYTTAGEFTVSGKLKSALWDNAVYYASYLFIALILIIYIALQPDLNLNWERTKAIAAAASNTWGLFVLVFMLGYGLIEVPRNCWYSTQRGYQLNRGYFKIAKLMGERSDAEESLEDALVTVHAISQTVGMADPRRPQVETILSKIPLEMMEKIKRRRPEAPFGSDPPTEKMLVNLHRQVIRALQTHHRTEAQWADMTQRVFELEDVNRNMISNEHVFKHTMSRAPAPFLARTIYNPTVEWYWKCLVSPLLLRFLAGVAAVMSVLIVWSEVTFFVPSPTLSMFALFVNLAKYNYHAIEMICFITICYLCICTYYTIFKIRVLNYYYLARNHQSDEYTLLFSGALLCRLTPPLCLNFLSIIHMDSHVIESPIMETAYTQVMGHMDVVSIVSDYFNIYFPIALLGLTAATYFSVGSRILSALGFQQFLDQDSELTQEMLEEGKEHIKREKRRIQRMVETATRRREFAERFTDQEPGRASETRYRQPDIVKSRGGGATSAASFPASSPTVLASPERALLGPHHHNNPSASPTASYSAGRNTSVLDIGEPGSDHDDDEEERGPPRNIFDDL